MTALSDFVTARATAGARYAAAVTELHAAYVGLLAYDRAAANVGVLAENPSRTFFAPPDALPLELVHPTYVPTRGTTDWRDEAKVQADSLITSITGAVRP